MTCFCLAPYLELEIDSRTAELPSLHLMKMEKMKKLDLVWEVSSKHVHLRLLLLLLGVRLSV